MAKTRGADQVIRNLRTFDQRYRATVRTTLARQAEITEARLKAEHPWQNRTGAAEAGLRAGVLEEGQAFVLRAQHSVPYGVFLETKHQGRYAVLRPVLRTQWPRAVHAVARAVREVKAT